MPMWCKKFLKLHKKKFQARAQTKRTPFLLIKKNNKKKDSCFTCVKSEHYCRECLDAKWKLDKKYANMVEIDRGTSGYGNLLIHLACH